MPDSDRSRQPLDLETLWTPELMDKLAHPAPVRTLLQSLTSDNAATYDLLFYGSFADKLLTVMRREGKDADGFARMQQSFRETVELVRSLVKRAGELGFSRADAYTQLTADGMAKLLELMHDLAIIKQYHLRQTGGESD